MLQVRESDFKCIPLHTDVFVLLVKGVSRFEIARSQDLTIGDTLEMIFSQLPSSVDYSRKAISPSKDNFKTIPFDHDQYQHVQQYQATTPMCNPIQSVGRARIRYLDIESLLQNR